MLIIKKDDTVAGAKYGIYEDDYCIFWTETAETAEKVCEEYAGNDWGWEQKEL